MVTNADVIVNRIQIQCAIFTSDYVYLFIMFIRNSLSVEFLTYSSTSSVAEMQNPDIVTRITQSKDT